MKRLNSDAYTLVFEAIIFAVLVALSLFIFYQLSPSSPTIASDSHTSELKTIGEDALRYMYQKLVNVPDPYPSNALAYYFITKNVTALKNNLSTFLPNTVEYNIYISNGIDTMFWFSSHGDNKMKPLGSTVRVHRLVPAPSELIEDKKNWGKEIADVFNGYTGSTYDIILELWYV